jgi:hypothetical protein
VNITSGQSQDRASGNLTMITAHAKGSSGAIKLASGTALEGQSGSIEITTGKASGSPQRNDYFYNYIKKERNEDEDSGSISIKAGPANEGVGGSINMSAGDSFSDTYGERLTRLLFLMAPFFLYCLST